MSYLVRLLPRRINRVANIAVAIFATLFVVGGGSAYLHYCFFAGVEVIGTIRIAVRMAR